MDVGKWTRTDFKKLLKLLKDTSCLSDSAYLTHLKEIENKEYIQNRAARLMVSTKYDQKSN